MSARIALLIDAENISHTNLPRILTNVSRHGGIVVVQAVYGNWNSPTLKQWQTLAVNHEFEIRHQTSATNSKNAADMQLIMDAMEILYSIETDVFCLVSNDADYVPLCDKLREGGKYIIGMGGNDAAETFIRACDEFIFITRNKLPAPLKISALKPLSVKKPVNSVNPPKPPNNPQIVSKLLVTAFSVAPEDANRWVTLSALETTLRQFQSTFKTSTYGHTTLSALLQSMSNLVEFQTNGTAKSARLKNSKQGQPNLRHLLTQAFATASKDANRWVTITDLSLALRQVQKDFKANAYGRATLSKVLQTMPDFIELKGSGTAKSARLKK